MARDRYHNNVRIALEADGWTITHDPFRLRVDDVAVEIDLAAHKIIGAEKEGQKIAVEVKSFISHSLIHDFEQAYGQFSVYRRMLRIKEPERHLF